MVSDLVYKHCGINLHDGKKELVRARIAKRLRLGRYKSFAEYFDSVLNDPTGREFSDFIDALSTNLTSFFRESQHFDYLRETYLPKIMGKKAAAGKSNLRAWSAGCSSGEEPYTLAITLLETAEKAGGKWNTRILATDISTQMLETASQGVYPLKRVQPVSLAQRKRFFQAGELNGVESFQVGPTLREMIRFRYLNLQEPWPFKGPFDLIFCRNVMIYFDKPTQERLVARYASCLADGGLLFTGHSESLTGIKHSFRFVQPTIYEKL